MKDFIDKVDFYIVDNGSILVEYDKPNETEPSGITVAKGNCKECVLHIGSYIYEIADKLCVSNLRIYIEEIKNEK